MLPCSEIYASLAWRSFIGGGEDRCRFKCEHDLVKSMRVYVPLMIEFCTGPKQLHIELSHEDWDLSGSNAAQMDLNEPKSATEALDPLYEDLYKIHSLDCWSVVDSKGATLKVC